MPSKSRFAPWFPLAAAVLVLDRFSKALVLESLAPGESRPITGFFNLVLVFNTGAAFSFLAGERGWQTFLFAGIATVASVVISYLIVKNREKRLFCCGLALILGGALGNLYDRLVYGKVVDFLDFHLQGWHWPAFNVADSAIMVGAAILIAESFMHPARAREKQA
ncbi:MAG: lipoprotein signal peptidase [Candidatus Parcubacteria bacterium]|nr:lipoprotein signal peptidase [Burkholderiales bacterium]